MIRRFFWWFSLLIFLWMLHGGFFSPVIFVHYSKDATEPISYMYEDSNRYKSGDSIYPGTTKRYLDDYCETPEICRWLISYIDIRGGELVDHPFDRLDIYIEADGSIHRVDKKMGWRERLFWLSNE